MFHAPKRIPAVRRKSKASGAIQVFEHREEDAGQKGVRVGVSVEVLVQGMTTCLCVPLHPCPHAAASLPVSGVVAQPLRQLCCWKDDMQWL